MFLMSCALNVLGTVSKTNESLRPNTIEETYELCDALMKHDDANICKELGDVLLHVCFYAKIGSGAWRVRYGGCV